MQIEEIYKNLVSQKRKHNKYILYRYDIINSGSVNAYMESANSKDIEKCIKEQNLILIPYSVFMAEGKRLKQYLSKSRV